MSFDPQAWINRADQLIARPVSRSQNDASEISQFATSFLTAVYGPASTQLRAFSDGLAAIHKKGDMVEYRSQHHAIGAIKNAKAEIEAGLIGKLRVQVTGEVLADLIAVAKEALGRSKGDSDKNVAAVLTAAAFEDLMRRMASELGGLPARPPMSDVISFLKDAGLLKGGEVGTAQSFLKFRNDSLHADWNNVTRAQVESCFGLLDSLLLKYFS